MRIAMDRFDMPAHLQLELSTTRVETHVAFEALPLERMIAIRTVMSMALEQIARLATNSEKEPDSLSDYDRVGPMFVAKTPFPPHDIGGVTHDV